MTNILRKPGLGSLQKGLYKALMKQAGVTRANMVIYRRIRYWNFSEQDATHVFATLTSFVLSRLPSSQKISVLRTICNAWNTTSRFHQPVGTCMFGCEAPADDRMQHYLCCLAIARPALRLLGL